MKIGDSIQKRCPNCSGIINGIVAQDDSKTTTTSNQMAQAQWQAEKNKDGREWHGMDNTQMVWEQHYCPILPRHPRERDF